MTRTLRTLIVALIFALSLGCGTVVTVGTRGPVPPVPEKVAEAPAESVQPCGELKGIAIAIVWGQAEAGCGLKGAAVSIPFANMLQPILGQALQALPGVGSPPAPPPTIIVNGAESVVTNAEPQPAP